MGKSSNKMKFIFGAVVILVIIAILYLILTTSIISTQLPPGDTCVATSGYLCQNATYLHNNGNLTISVGQNTGYSWSSVNFAFIPQGTAIKNGLPVISFNSTAVNTFYSSTGLNSDQVVTVYLPISGEVSIGTPATGTIWVQYVTNTSQTQQYAEIAAVNIKAR